MDDWRSTLTETEREKLVGTKMPNQVTPMLATRTGNPFPNANRVFERKLDGERSIAFYDGETVHLNCQLTDSEVREMNHNPPEREIIVCTFN